MYCSSNRVFSCLIVLASLPAMTNVGSAALIASYAGPKTFDGSTRISLANGDFGVEGTVEFDAVITNFSGSQCLWDAYDSSTNIEPIIRAENWNGTNRIEFDYYNPYPSKAVNQDVATIDWPSDTQSHHIYWSWKEGVGTRIAVDGNVMDLALLNSLTSWTSIANAIGATGDGSGRWKCNSGTTISNFVLTNTSTLVPEPSAIMLAATGLMSLLCYAWRKRR